MLLVSCFEDGGRNHNALAPFQFNRLRGLLSEPLPVRRPRLESRTYPVSGRETLFHIDLDGLCSAWEHGPLRCQKAWNCLNLTALGRPYARNSGAGKPCCED